MAIAMKSSTTARRTEAQPHSLSVDEATPVKQQYSHIDMQTPMSLDANNVLRVGTTGLWGVWEMWCDFPSKPAMMGRHNSHHSSMTEKLAQYQPPTWLDTVKSIGVFDTAEGFWVIHDCTLEPSRLTNGSNYYLFRQNIAPMWEHEANRRGGKWVAQFSSDQGADVDQAWMNACVAIIGEQFPGFEEEICGICVAKRKSGFKILLWTRNAENEEAQIAIGKHLAQCLGSRQHGQLKYLRHCETLEACCSPSNVNRGGSPMMNSAATSSAANSPTNVIDSTATFAAKIPETLYVV
ncbi:eukaryotic translation initiation factor 4E, putative [Bodo saltans]|uniref:Eukaryotic translation initiation factor 4E, putative n=1 Tax=Bodo saltans TaxID=75058 RepID=A0A0S4KG92_BODSA|nr:eukaryotic translation initiation factor 4E, putative [Bodo saltans]|eukprot:CUI14148.1 eukaryotic translation initiation factor 4E, putative [Bodo saltans]